MIFRCPRFQVWGSSALCATDTVLCFVVLCTLGLQESQFYSIDKEDTYMCSQAAIDSIKLQLNITEAAKSRIRTRLNKAIDTMNKNANETKVHFNTAANRGIKSNSKDDIMKNPNYNLAELMKKEEMTEEFEQSLSSMQSSTATTTATPGKKGSVANLVAAGKSLSAPSYDVESANRAHGFESSIDLNKFFGPGGIAATVAGGAGSDNQTLAQLSAIRAEGSPVNAIALRGLTLTTKALTDLADRFLKPWQVDLLLKADFSDTHLDNVAVSLLAPRFSVACHLMHLNVSCCRLGEVGTKELLEALNEGGASQTLLRIDLKQNNITMATDALFSLSKFPRLRWVSKIACLFVKKIVGLLLVCRALDLSLNYITLDVRRQQDFFFSVMLPLRELRSFSVAFNRIQDIGESCCCLCCGVQ
jgi:ribosome-associated translation inhibitor RaiA